MLALVVTLRVPAVMSSNFVIRSSATLILLLYLSGVRPSSRFFCKRQKQFGLFGAVGKGFEHFSVTSVANIQKYNLLHDKYLSFCKLSVNC